MISPSMSISGCSVWIDKNGNCQSAIGNRYTDEAIADCRNDIIGPIPGVPLAKLDPRMQSYDEQTRYSGLLYVLMLVLAAAFAGFIWNLYTGGDSPPRIAAPSGAYKMEPPPELADSADAAEENALFESLEGQTETQEATPRAGPEQVAET